MKKINSFVIAVVCVATALIGCSMGKGGVTNGKDSEVNKDSVHSGKKPRSGEDSHDFIC